MTVDFLGYTGPPLGAADGDTPLGLGDIGYDNVGRPVLQTNGVNGDTSMEIALKQDNRLRVKWMCASCQVLAAPQLQVLIRRSSGSQGDLYSGDRLVSAKAIKWKVESTPIVTDEINIVNGSLVPQMGNVFRGREASIIDISLIPTSYQNFVDGAQAEGYRVQPLGEIKGSQCHEDNHMKLPVTTENAVSFCHLLLHAPTSWM